MTRIALPLTVAVLALGLPLAPAHADQARTFVSAATGNDGGGPPGSGTNVDCLRLSPCKTFGQAAAHTLANGEVTVLDPGSYGAVTITQNISIVNDGVGEAGILVSGGFTGITVNAPGAAVTLRGITIKGIGFGGGVGIDFQAGAALNVENCTVRNLGGLGHGIIFEPAAGAAHLTVSNSSITDNFGAGIKVAPTGSAVASAVINGVGLHTNGLLGLWVVGAGTGNVKVTMTDSAATNGGHTQSGGGILVQSTVTPTTVLMVRTVIANNDGTAVRADGAAARIWISESTVKSNNSGLSATAGSVINTFGENLVFDHISSPGPLTPALKQ
jgi:hypothetical protein